MSLPFKTHELLDHEGVSHGFFGRQGGVSKGQYESLNVGAGSADTDENVQANRTLVAGVLGTSESCLLSLSQIHSADVLIVDAPFGKPLSGELPQADGLVTKTPGLALSALSADCGPVLFHDAKAGVIGACHAGWKGALSGVTTSTLKAMEAIGASRENMTAVLGPCISRENYEVGQEFRENFLSHDTRYDQFFVTGSPRNPKSTKPHFDLKGFILDRLAQDGVERIAALPDCTYGQGSEYFSYRYNTHQGVSDYGRNISAIILTQ